MFALLGVCVSIGIGSVLELAVLPSVVEVSRSGFDRLRFDRRGRMVDGGCVAALVLPVAAVAPTVSMVAAVPSETVGATSRSFPSLALSCLVD